MDTQWTPVVNGTFAEGMWYTSYTYRSEFDHTQTTQTWNAALNRWDVVSLEVRKNYYTLTRIWVSNCGVMHTAQASFFTLTTKPDEFNWQAMDEFWNVPPGPGPIPPPPPPGSPQDTTSDHPTTPPSGTAAGELPTHVGELRRVRVLVASDWESYGARLKAVDPIDQRADCVVVLPPNSPFTPTGPSSFAYGNVNQTSYDRYYLDRADPGVYGPYIIWQR